MPARDAMHNAVCRALVKDGWTITHDPLRVRWGGRFLYLDLGAEKLVAAEKDGVRIAVEIKGFSGPSEMADLEQALGQYCLYLQALAANEPTRKLYLAVPEGVFTDLLDTPEGRQLREAYRMAVLVLDELREEVLRWTPSITTGPSSATP